VLAAYEPSLADIPGLASEAAPPALGPHEARARVFSCLRETLFAYAAGQPLLIAVDDLQWADDLTLGFIAELDDMTLAAHRASIICTYRIEEATDAVRSLRDDHGFTDIALDRLDATAVGQMIAGMLALHQAPAELADVLVQHSDGNPFFVVEYLRAAIDQGVLSRDHDGRWQLQVDQGVEALSAAPQPPAVRDLMARRIALLPPAALSLARWAAVLGRELDGDLLEEVAGGEDSAALVILRQRQILEEGIRGRLRFVHERLRELVHQQIEAEELSAMHARAASVLASRRRASWR
jgi:predicted ATPase